MLFGGRYPRHARNLSCIPVPFSSPRFATVLQQRLLIRQEVRPCVGNNVHDVADEGLLIVRSQRHVWAIGQLLSAKGY
jgi:hypothetical protein